MRAELLSTRRKQILEVLTERKAVRVSTLEAMFDVTGETIRKDLIAMEKQRVLTRRHGMVELVPSGSEDAVEVRAMTNLPAKQRIALAALELIPGKDGDVVGLDAGSSTWFLAQLLAKRRGQTVVTHSMEVADAFVKSDLSNNVYLTGGVLRTVDRSFYGPWTLRSLNSIRMTVSVLGTNGTLNWEGLGAVSYDDADVKQAYAKNSDCVIAVFDSTKLHTTTLLESVRWSQIDIVITDEGISPAERERIEKRTQLIIA